MSYEDGKKLKIFTGNANPELAKEIADYLGLELGKAFVGKFNNGEIQVMIDESVRGKDVFVIQPTCQPANDTLMELLIMQMPSNALRLNTLPPLFRIMVMHVRTARPAAVNRLHPNWLLI